MARRVLFGSRRLRLLNLIRAAWPDLPTTLQDWVVAAHLRATTIFRMTAATVLGYLASVMVIPGNRDLTAGLTALLVVQATSFGTIRMGLVRVGAVLTGVIVAVLVSSQVGLEWWSLAIVVALSLLVAPVFRLHAQLAEAPISGMLILAGTSPDVEAGHRIVNTLVGAGVGMAMTVLAPPALPISSASTGVRDVTRETGNVLDRISEAMAMDTLTQPQLNGWLARTRVIADEIVTVRETVREVKQSRILNTRAIGVRDVEPILRSALETTESVLLSVRGLLSALLQDAPASLEGGYDDDIDDDVRRIFAMVISDTGECVRAFGDLVEAEATGRVEDAEIALAHSLEVLRETRAILTELVMVETADNPSLWMLRGSTLGAVEQIVTALDLERRAAVRREWLEGEDHRLAVPTVLRETLIHPERPLPRGLDRGLRNVSPRLRRVRPSKKVNPGTSSLRTRRGRVTGTDGAAGGAAPRSGHP